MKKISILKGIVQFVFILLFLSSTAQETENQPSDSVQYLKDPTSYTLKDIDSLQKIDSLWYTAYYNPDWDHDIWDKPDSVQVPVTLDTTILKKQIADLDAKTQIDIVYHPALVSTIQYFLTKKKKYLEKLFGIAESYYYPMFEEKLMKYQIPLEIKHLAIIESALNPRAQSRMGATGLWQFMYFTGKRYGLDMTSYLDERMSPERSTEAAAKLLDDLYGLFDDWNLVLAAYNSGPGNVTKAIRRSGGYKNYWNLRPFLPRETAGYIPQFQAVWFLYEYRKYYGITPEKPAYSFLKTDTIQVRKTISFDQLHRILHIPVKELEFLNPQYKLDIVPYVPSKKYAIRLPHRYAGIFIANEPEIYAFVEAEWNAKEKPLPKYYKLPTYHYYHVRPGDYLGKIALRYHTSVRKIMQWNHLRSTRLHIGQKLKIYTRTPVFTQVATKTKSSKKTSKNNKIIYHTIKPGDSLWNIARKYRVSVRNLMRWNGLKSNKLQPGKKLKIYRI